MGLEAGAGLDGFENRPPAPAAGVVAAVVGGADNRLFEVAVFVSGGFFGYTRPPVGNNPAAGAGFAGASDPAPAAEAPGFGPPNSPPPAGAVGAGAPVPPALPPPNKPPVAGAPKAGGLVAAGAPKADGAVVVAGLAPKALAPVLAPPKSPAEPP